MLRLCVLCLCALSACASPREACLRNAFGDVATLDRLIAETQGNLDRGYAIVREPYVRTGLEFCLGRGAFSPRVNVGLHYCNTVETAYREREVAIDAEAERRKLGNLRERRAEAADRAERTARACPPPAS